MCPVVQVAKAFQLDTAKVKYHCKWQHKNSMPNVFMLTELTKIQILHQAAMFIVRHAKN